MTQQFDPEKITRLLNQSTRQMDADAVTLSALADARQCALTMQAAQSPAFSFATAYPHGLTRWTDRLIPHSAQMWIAALLLLAIFVTGAGYWQSMQEQQIDELDVAILTDDMPIEIFVD